MREKHLVLLFAFIAGNFLHTQARQIDRRITDNLAQDASTLQVLSLLEDSEPSLPRIVSSGRRDAQEQTNSANTNPSIDEINRQISLQHENPLEIAQISPADLMFGDGGGSEDRSAVVSSAATNSAANAAGTVSGGNVVTGSSASNRRNPRTNNRSPPRRGRLPAEVENQRNNNSNRRNRGNRRNRSNKETRVLEGHKLITRALWRIFDALMEKNENAAIQERVNLIEAAVREMLTHSTKLEDQLDVIKDTNEVQDDHINELSLAMHDVKMIAEKVEKLEYWKSYFEGSQNDDVSHLVSREATYSSCPPRFETVYGECFLLVDQGKKSWHEARRECAKFGADLAAPRNFDSLREFLQNLAYSPEYVWVGASRQGNGDWTWLQGNREESPVVDMSEKTWNEDLPAGLGNCMGLYEGASYRAYDYSCDELDLFVCQYFL